MAAVFSANKVLVQFNYPFAVERWGILRRGLSGALAEQTSGLVQGLVETQERLDAKFGPEAPRIFDPATGTLGTPGKHDGRRLREDDCDVAVIAAVRAHMRRDATSPNHSFRVEANPVCYELIELLHRAEAEQSAEVMRLLCRLIDSDEGMPLLRSTEFVAGDNRGTRGYLERKQPLIKVRLLPTNVALLDPEVLPDLSPKLPASPLADGSRGCRLKTIVRLASTGFGCLSFKAGLATEQGLLERVDEIAFTVDPLEGPPGNAVEKKAAFGRALREVIQEACRTREIEPIELVLADFSDVLDTRRAFSALQSLVSCVTVVSAPLLADDIVDLANLDRGAARGREPRLVWETPAGPREGVLADCFRYTTEEVLLDRLSAAIIRDPKVRSFLGRKERRAECAAVHERAKNELLSGLSGLSLDGDTLVVEEHPYVVTFISAPAAFKVPEAQDLALATRHFRDSIDQYRKELTQIRMKSKWAGIRSDGDAANRGFDNLFYSDLMYMAVDIRGALCLHYAPATAEEYLLIPELAHAHKYLAELDETIQSLRMLWYAYVTHDHFITEDIKSIASALDALKEDALNERFLEVIEGLAEVTQGIDRRKMALAETMHDPLSRKAGSSVFSEMIERTSQTFQLDSLYSDLRNKLDRLDMLGLHVSGNVQQYSNLVVQEGSRSAQLTLEFLEAFIIAFYMTELIELSLPERMKETLFPFADQSQWWGFYTVALGVFLTALPLITLIRRSRSRFSFENPPWLERLERFGMIAGPAILLGLVFLGNVRVPGGHAEPPSLEAFTWSSDVRQWLWGALTALLFIAVQVVWRRAEIRVDEGATSGG